MSLKIVFIIQDKSLVHKLSTIYPIFVYDKFTTVPIEIKILDADNKVFNIVRKILPSFNNTTEKVTVDDYPNFKIDSNTTIRNILQQVSTNNFFKEIVNLRMRITKRTFINSISKTISRARHPETPTIQINSESIPMIRTSSIKAQEQLNGTCYAYAISRCLTKYIKNIIPEHFKLSRLSILYDRKDNCSVEIENLENTRLKISECTLKPRYNYMCLFFYIFFTIVNKYGLDGYSVSIIMREILENFSKFFNLDDVVNETNKVISIKIDNDARTLLQAFINKLPIFKSQITKNMFHHYYGEETFTVQTKRENWFTNFPDVAKETLKLGYYVVLSFAMPLGQFKELTDVYSTFESRKRFCRNTDTAENYFSVDPNDPYISEDKISGHAVVITGYDEKDKSLTIINSWGSKWGNNGYIKLIPEHYWLFVMDTNCYAFNLPQYKMSISYFKPPSQTDTTLLNIGRRFIGRGGKNKTKKYKSHKNKK